MMLLQSWYQKVSYKRQYLVKICMSMQGPYKDIILRCLILDILRKKYNSIKSLFKYFIGSYYMNILPYVWKVEEFRSPTFLSWCGSNSTISSLSFFTYFLCRSGQVSLTVIHFFSRALHYFYYDFHWTYPIHVVPLSMLWRSNVIGRSIILHKSLPWTVFFSSFPVELLFGGRSRLVRIYILLFFSYPTWMFNFPICRTVGCYAGTFWRGIFFPLDPTCIYYSIYLEF